MIQQNLDELVETNLRCIVQEIALQSHLANEFPSEGLSFEETVSQLREYVELAGEYGIAYELIVAILSRFHFSLTGNSAIKLVEVALIMGFKTEQEEDSVFDRR